MAIALQSQRPIALRSAPLCTTAQSQRPRSKAIDRAEWDRRLAAFDAARAADKAHAHMHGLDWNLPKELLDAGYASASKEVLEEDDLLGEAVCQAEEALMEWPSPDAAAFALKVLFAHQRDIGQYEDIIHEEAKRFSGRAAR